MDSNEDPITPSLRQNCVREISVKDNCGNSSPGDTQIDRIYSYCS